MTSLFGAYQMRARLQPLLLAAFPAAVLVFALGAPDRTIGRVVAAISAFGVTALLMSFARDRGFRLQTDLWTTWGGPPTTTMLLSTSPSPAPDITVHRCHISRLLPGAEPLSDERDRDDPTGTVLTIERYTKFLRERTRDRNLFPVVFDANVGYGFRRNLLGLRHIGIAIAIVTISCSLGALVLVSCYGLERPIPLLCLSAAVGIVALVLWLRATPDWVREQANRYAHALLCAAEAIEPPTQTVSR